MNRKMIYCFVTLLLALSMASSGWAQPKSETGAPVISHAFAVERGYYGYIWRIYVEADDPDGDMLRIALMVNGPGQGRYPTDWVYLKRQYRKHFRGYVQWNTFSSKAGYFSEWTSITLKVSVLDERGNESNIAVFPFTFESGIGDPYKYIVPSPFEQGDVPRLGYVMIDLVNPGW